ncbi:MAG: CPBP family intramembrane glutamic endopeptidase [Spirochaetota bacterium]
MKENHPLGALSDPESRSRLVRAVLAAPLFIAVQAASAVLIRAIPGLSDGTAGEALSILILNSLALTTAGIAVAIFAGRRAIRGLLWKSLPEDGLLTARLSIPVVLIVFGTQGFVSLVLTGFNIDAGAYGAFAEALYTLPLPITIAGVALLPGFIEEFVFRHVVQRGFAPHLKPAGRIVLSAGIFGLVHILPIQIIAASLLGLSLGYIRERSRSLLPAIWGHVAANLAVLVIRPDVGQALPRDEVTLTTHMITGLVAAIFLVTGIFVFERSCRRLFEQNREEL